MRKMSVLLALAVTGCTVQVGGRSSAPVTVPSTTTTTVTVPATTVPVTTARPPDEDDLYLADVKATTDFGLWYDDTQIVDYGHTVCDYVAAGGDSSGFVAIIVDAGAESDASDTMMMAAAAAADLAISDLCPELTGDW